MVALLDVGQDPGHKNAATDEQRSQAHASNSKASMEIRVVVYEGLCKQHPFRETAASFSRRAYGT